MGSNGGGPSSPQGPGLQETWSQYSGFTERHPYLDLIATSHHIPDSGTEQRAKWLGRRGRGENAYGAPLRFAIALVTCALTACTISGNR